MDPRRSLDPLRIPAACKAGELAKTMVRAVADFASDVSRFFATGFKTPVVESPQLDVRNRIDDGATLNPVFVLEYYDDWSVIERLERRCERIKSSFKDRPTINHCLLDRHYKARGDDARQDAKAREADHKVEGPTVIVLLEWIGCRE
jgi:hypothetical protein